MPNLAAAKSTLARIKQSLRPPVTQPTEGPVTHTSEGITVTVDPNSSHLLQADITTPEFRLKNGVSVGLSWTDFKRSLTTYQGPESPNIVTIRDGTADYLVRLQFQERTLRRIEFRKTEKEATKSIANPDAGGVPTVP